MNKKAALMLMLVFIGSVRCSSKIKKVVVLMEENRSFDHMFGFYNRIDPRVDGLKGDENNSYYDGNKLLTKTVSDDASYVAPVDPNHSFEGTRFEVWGSDSPAKHEPPTMSGFANKSGPSALQMFSPERLPVISKLAEEFALFDAWFCSLPGPTIPNRMFVHTATSNGIVTNDGPDGNGYPPEAPQPTIFGRLKQKGHTSKVYYVDWSVSWFMNETFNMKDEILSPYEQFFIDAKKGELPTYSFIEPRFFPADGKPCTDQHPDHDVVEGERLIKNVYEALRSSPDWNQTLFLITYDEHGGFYDHVPPPYNIVPNPDGKSLPFFNFTDLGVRVPTLAISPWIAKGTLVHTPSERQKQSETSSFEASSIIATLRELFDLGEPFTARDAWAARFTDILSLESPRIDTPATLPDVPPPDPKLAELQASKPVNGLQNEFLDQLDALFGMKIPRPATQGEAGELVREYLERLKGRKKTSMKVEM